MKKQKAFIVGSGIGGMALSVLLANEGYKTRVFEKNAILGGRCTSYEKIHENEKFIVDMWTHMFPTAERAFNKIFKKANLPHRIEFFHFSEDMSPEIWLGRSKKIPLPNNLTELPKFFKMFWKNKPLEKNAGKKDGIMKLAGDLFTLSRRKLKELDQFTFEEWLRTYSINDLLVNSLGSVCAFMFVNMAYDNEVKTGSAAGETIRCMRDWFKMITSGYPLGGSVGIVNGYKKCLEDLKGSVQTEAKVEKIVVEDGRVKGLDVNGDFLESNLVISNAGVKETILKLVGEEHFPAEYIKRVENFQVSEGADTWAFYSMKMGIDQKIIEAPVVFPFIWMDKSKELLSIRDLIENYIMKDELPPSSGMYITVPSNMDPSLCPKDKQIVNLGCIAPVETSNLQKWYDFYLDVIEEVIPDFREHILFLDVHRTGRPLKNWTGRFQGDAVGISQSVGQVREERPKVNTPIKGLYLVGADVGIEGIGTELSALSALRTLKGIKNP